MKRIRPERAFPRGAPPPLCDLCHKREASHYIIGREHEGERAPSEYRCFECFIAGILYFLVVKNYADPTVLGMSLLDKTQYGRVVVVEVGVDERQDPRIHPN